MDLKVPGLMTRFWSLYILGVYPSRNELCGSQPLKMNSIFNSIKRSQPTETESVRLSPLHFLHEEVSAALCQVDYLCARLGYCAA